MKDADLQELRELLDTKKRFIALGQIKQLGLADDRSVWRALVSVFPDNEEVICRMTWQQVGPETGIYGPAEVGDIVCVAFADSEPDQGIVLARLSSKTDKIPLKASEGHTYIKALPDKNLYLCSENKIYLSKTTDVTENLVLGQVFKTMMSDFMDQVIAYIDSYKQHTHVGNLGYDTTPPSPSFITEANNIKSEVESIQSDPLNNENVLSDLSFTEKGN